MNTSGISRNLIVSDFTTKNGVRITNGKVFRVKVRYGIFTRYRNDFEKYTHHAIGKFPDSEYVDAYVVPEYFNAEYEYDGSFRKSVYLHCFQAIHFSIGVFNEKEMEYESVVDFSSLEDVDTGNLAGILCEEEYAFLMKKVEDVKLRCRMVLKNGNLPYLYGRKLIKKWYEPNQSFKVYTSFRNMFGRNREHKLRESIETSVPPPLNNDYPVFFNQIYITPKRTSKFRIPIYGMKMVAQESDYKFREQRWATKDTIIPQIDNESRDCNMREFKVMREYDMFSQSLMRDVSIPIELTYIY